MADNKSREVKQVGTVAEDTGKKIGDIMVKLDISNTLTELKAIQREVRKAKAALKELEHLKNNQAFLSIELNSLDSVPKVFYKGEEIKGKVHVAFDWKTQTQDLVASPTIVIEYVDQDSKRPATKKIAHVPHGVILK